MTGSTWTRGRVPWVRGWIVWCVLAIAAVILLAGHWAHALGFLPYGLLLLCPLLHMFHHGGHARHDGHAGHEGHAGDLGPPPDRPDAGNATKVHGGYRGDRDEASGHWRPGGGR